MPSTHPVLINDIYNGHQLASMGSKRDVGNAANFNKAFEHLKIKDIQVTFLKSMYPLKTSTREAPSFYWT